MKNWNKIGAVVVYKYGTNPKWYASLEDAIMYLHNGFNSYAERKPLLELINKRGWLGSSKYYFLDIGDRWIIKDDLGLMIPHWKIEEAYKNLPNEKFVNRYNHYYRSRYRFKFRDGSVENIRCYRGGCRGRKKLWQAFKEDHYDRHDEDLKEYKFKRKKYENRFYDLLEWECRKSDYGQRNWKNYRKTQWKEKEF